MGFRIRVVFFGSLMLSLAFGNAFSQSWREFKKIQEKNWALGKVYMASGSIVETELQLLISFTEGTLQIKDGEQVASLSPRQVSRFVYYDSSFSRVREFVSVPSKFQDRNGSKNIFLELIYEGDRFSLMSRYLPVAKLGKAIVPLPNYYLGYAVWTYGRVELAMFVYDTNSKYAYQVTKRISYFDNQVETKNEERIDFEFDKHVLAELFGEDLNEMKKYCRENRLDFNSIKGFKEAVKYANGTSFKYDRKGTPKRLRN